ARQQLTMRDRMPPLLRRMRPHVSPVNWGIMREVGLTVSLIERWDLRTNVFHLPTREMTITLEDVYRILRLPIV
ncbi:hypothetical protein KI387_009385, partial [Taxus chinensis]